MGSGIALNFNELPARCGVIPEFAVWSGRVFSHINIIDPGCLLRAGSGPRERGVASVGEFFDAAVAAEWADEPHCQSTTRKEGLLF